jgi:hypothetical protein
VIPIINNEMLDLASVCLSPAILGSFDRRLTASAGSVISGDNGDDIIDSVDFMGSHLSSVVLNIDLEA